MTQPHEYEYEFDVPASAIDENGHVNNVEYVRWMQEAATRHYVAAGGMRVAAAAGMTWVVRAHHVEYLRAALAGERVRVRTWPEFARRSMSLRKYEFIRPADGALLVRGETEWVFVEVPTGRPRPIPPEVQALFGG